MKKLILIAISAFLLLSLIACTKDKEQTSSQQENSKPSASSEKKETPPLTQDEQTMVGLWEADNGDLLAIKGRTGRDEYSANDFVFDAILYQASTKQWIKITREDGSFFENKEGSLVLGDDHLCPTDAEQTMWQMTSQRIRYNAENQTIEYSYEIDGMPVEGLNTVFHKSDKDVETADWDWYYEIHPERK